MVVLSELVFDDYVHGAGTDYYTPARYNEVLGRVDKLLIQAVAVQSDQEGHLSLHIQHSADRRNWANKTEDPEIYMNLLTGFGASITTTSLAGADAGTN